jgi:hypothetical protein
VAGEAELGAVGVLHPGIQAAPDHDATQYANDNHAQHRALRRVEKALEKAVLAFGFLSFVSHGSNPDYASAISGSTFDFESMEMARRAEHRPNTKRRLTKNWRLLPSYPSPPLQRLNNVTIGYRGIIAGRARVSEQKK